MSESIIDPGDRPTEYSQQTLSHLHHHLKLYSRAGDNRAVFLHAYCIVTRNMLHTLEEQACGNSTTFLDPDWVCYLLNEFGDLYLDSLDAFDQNILCTLPWQRAHTLATGGTTTVIEDLLLGINAHINFDLAQALHRTMVKYADDQNPLGLWRRKFDHDRVNLVLRNSIDEIGRSISRDHGGMVALLDRFLGNWDERAARFGVEHFRERTFDRACQLLAARNKEEQALVQTQLESEALEVVDLIVGMRGFAGGFFHGIQCRARKRNRGINLAALLPQNTECMEKPRPN